MGAYFCLNGVELYRSIKAEDIAKIKLSIGEEGHILDLLKNNFSDDNVTENHDYLPENDVPFEAWSRMED